MCKQVFFFNNHTQTHSFTHRYTNTHTQTHPLKPVMYVYIIVYLQLFLIARIEKQAIIYKTDAVTLKNSKYFMIIYFVNIIIVCFYKINKDSLNYKAERSLSISHNIVII